MSTTEAQTWVAIVGGIVTVAVRDRRFSRSRTRRARSASVGAAFSAMVESLSEENLTRQMAAAVLLRRFLDTRTEQGVAKAPYRTETIEVIAGMLKRKQPESRSRRRWPTACATPDHWRARISSTANS